MKGIKLNLNNVKVRTKLIMLYVICVLFPIILTNLIFLDNISRSIKVQRIEHIDTSLEKIESNIKKAIEDVVLLSNTLYTDNSLNNYLEYGYPNVDEFYSAFHNYLRGMVLRSLPVYNQIRNINIYTDNHTIPNSQGYLYIDPQVKQQEWYIRFEREQSRILGVAYVAHDILNGQVKHLGFVRKLDYFSNSGRNSVNKLLKIDLRISAIYDILVAERLEGDIYLVDDTEKVVVSTTDKSLSLDKGQFINFKDIKISKDALIVEREFSNYSILNNWRIVGVFNQGRIFKELHGKRQFVFFLAFVNLLVATTVTLLVSKSFQYRLNIISYHMEKVRKQRFEKIDCEEGSDEIGELIREFNRMAEKIQNLIENEYKLNLQKKNLELETKQAEINALQSQINPHFLFNTLETVRMRSMIKGEKETAQIIKYLSMILRRLTVWDKDLVTVREEINFVEYYLKIQKYRFGDELEYRIHVDNNALECKIPKMTLQPLVENACVHGIEKTKDTGMVSVSVRMNGQCLYCEIEDNGIGFSQEKLEQFWQNVKHDTSSYNSIGMVNVYNRMRLFYGDRFQLRIESQENQGTKVCIAIPVD